MDDEDLLKSSRFQRRAAAKQAKLAEQELERVKRIEVMGSGGGTEQKKKKKDKKNKVDEMQKEDVKIQPYGDVVAPDFSVGAESEQVVVEQPCMWDEPISRALQVSRCRVNSVLFVCFCVCLLLFFTAY